MIKNARSDAVPADCRIRWVDYAKGICIILVVMMQATHDYGILAEAEGWLHHVVAFARPFRMPDFFLLSGLFLSLSINSPRRDYLDRKVFHFIYFYLLWLTIQMAFTEAGTFIESPQQFFTIFIIALIDPINSLWFVHMLAIFYVVTRLLRRLPKIAVFAAAAALQIAYSSGLLDTEWSVLNRFFDRYIYFFTGYAAAPWIFSFATKVLNHKALAIATLLNWALINGWFTMLGIDQTPVVGLLLGFAGAAAIVAVGSLLSTSKRMIWLAHTGKHSMVVYLTAFLPMKILLVIFIQTELVPDVGLASAIITFAAVSVPLILHRFIRNSRLKFLYQRPSSFRFSAAPASASVSRI
jgi:uncharacterized membrane protein YcfT